MSRDSNFEEQQSVSTDNENMTNKEVSKVSSSTDPRKTWSPMPSPRPARNPIWQWIVTWVLFLGLAGVVIMNNAGYKYPFLDAIFPSTTEPVVATEPTPTDPAAIDPTPTDPAATDPAPTDPPLPLQIEIQVKPNPDIGLNAFVVGFDAIATIKVSQQSGDSWIPVPNRNLKISYTLGETTLVTDSNGLTSFSIDKTDIVGDQQSYNIEVDILDEQGNLTSQSNVANINVIVPIKQKIPGGAANLLSLTNTDITLLGNVSVIPDWFDVYLLDTLEKNNTNYAKVYLVGWVKSGIVGNQLYPDSKNALSVVSDSQSNRIFFTDDAKGLWNIQLFPIDEQSGNYTKTVIIGLIPSDQLEPAE